MAPQACTQHSLDGIVVIGGDDSNTNAAVIAEYFLAQVGSKDYRVWGCGGMPAAGLLEPAELLACSGTLATAEMLMPRQLGEVCTSTATPSTPLLAAGHQDACDWRAQDHRWCVGQGGWLRCEAAHWPALLSNQLHISRQLPPIPLLLLRCVDLLPALTRPTPHAPTSHIQAT